MIDLNKCQDRDEFIHSLADRAEAFGDDSGEGRGDRSAVQKFLGLAAEDFGDFEIDGFFHGLDATDGGGFIEGRAGFIFEFSHFHDPGLLGDLETFHGILKAEGSLTGLEFGAFFHDELDDSLGAGSQMDFAVGFEEPLNFDLWGCGGF